MHPYWKVRRATHAMITADRKKKYNKNPILVNMELRTHEYFLCDCLFAAKEGSVQQTVTVSVPYLVNSTDIAKGDILTVEVEDAPVRQKEVKPQI